MNKYLFCAFALALPLSAQAGDDLGLGLDLGFASAYAFRGYNVFQESGQMDQNAMVNPAVTWAAGDSGLSFGYWGAFQVLGDNIGPLIDGALGAEQDIYGSWETSLSDGTSLSAALCWYLYPLADSDLVGTALPSYVEPNVSLGWSGPVDLGLTAAWFLGVQDQPGIRDISYLYLSPSVGRSLSFSDAVGLDLSLSYGFKLWHEGNEGADNVHDVLLGAGLPIGIGGNGYVTPSVSAGWTNLGGDALGVGDEVFAFGGVNAGTAF